MEKIFEIGFGTSTFLALTGLFIIVTFFIIYRIINKNKETSIIKGIITQLAATN